MIVSQLNSVDINFEDEIKALILVSSLPEPCEGGEVETQGSPALGLIRLTLSRNVACNIVKEKTTSGLLKALSNMYEKPSAMNNVCLMRRLFNLQISET